MYTGEQELDRQSGSEPLQTLDRVKPLTGHTLERFNFQ